LLLEDEGAIGSSTASLGEIVVDVEEVIIRGVTPWQHSRPATLPPLDIHERVKKGIVHGTQSEQELSLRIYFVSMLNLDSGKRFPLLNLVTQYL